MSANDSDEYSFSHPSSFSDQRFKVLVGATLQSSRVSDDTRKPKEGYLSTTFSCSLFQKDIYDAGNIVIYPKCMHRMLSSEYPTIVSELEETYRSGAFIYVGGSFQCLFPRNPQRFHKIKTELLCDMCIFPNNKPAILLTVVKDTRLKDHLIGYNLQMKRNLEEWISQTLVEFKALSVVVTPDDFRIRGRFQKITSFAEEQSPTKVLPSTLATMLLTMETFLRNLATCKFVHRFYGVTEEPVYLDQGILDEFIELMEEKNTKTVYSKCSDYKTLLVCELGYRLALIGHTSILSKSKEKGQFEELRKAQNLSISITYDDSIADENLEEGDVRLSSWKGGVILFRENRTETAAARRTLAASVVNHSTKAQDEATRNKLMDLVCLHIKRMEEQLANTLLRADSKHQISTLESYSMYSQDELVQTYLVGTDASKSPAPDIPGCKDSTVQEDLDSQYTDPQTSELCNDMQMAKIEDSISEEYLLANLNRSTFSHSEETIHNINIGNGRARSRVKDQTHMQEWLGNMSHTSTEGQPTHIRDPIYPNRIGRSDSQGSHQRKQSSPKQNKIPGEYRYTTPGSKQLLYKDQLFPSQQGYTRQPTFSPQMRERTEAVNENDSRPSHYIALAETHHDEVTTPLRVQHSSYRNTSLTNSQNTNASEHRPNTGPYSYRDPVNTSYITNQNASIRDTSAIASKQASSPYQHMDSANTSYVTNKNTSIRDTRAIASKQASSPYQHMDSANTSYITDQAIWTGDTRTKASEQRSSPSFQHMDPVNTSYIRKQDTSTGDKGFPKHNRNAGSESCIKPKGGQSFHELVSESHITNQGKPKASGDRRSLYSNYDHPSPSSNKLTRAKSHQNIHMTSSFENQCMFSISLEDLSAIPKGIVKRRSIAFE